MKRLQPSRRDFLKLTGTALGCALLGSAYGCGGGGDGGEGNPPTGGVPLPNGYVFYRIYSPGDLGLFPEISGLSPQVLLDERGQIFFSGQTAAGDFGFYSLALDLSGTPAIGAARRILLEGTAGPDGRIIDTLTAVDVDDDGTVAGVLAFEMENTDQGPGAVVTDRGSGMEILIDYNDDLPGNHGAYGGDFGDIDIEGGDVMVVARYGGDGRDAEGLFFLPGAEAKRAKVLLKTGEEIPEANGTIEGLGLVDLDEDGSFVMQAFGDDPLRPRQAPQSSRATGGVLFQGKVSLPRAEDRLLCACPSLELSRSALARAVAPTMGDSLYGPRIGGDEVTSYVAQLDDDFRLYRNRAVIAQSGDLSPGGAVIRTLIPGVVNGGGLTFFQLITDQGIELCANDGIRSALLLQRGDLVDGRPLDTLALGFHTSQADTLGRFVCYGQFADGQEALLLGIPV